MCFLGQTGGQGLCLTYIGATSDFHVLTGDSTQRKSPGTYRHPGWGHHLPRGWATKSALFELRDYWFLFVLAMWPLRMC